MEIVLGIIFIYILNSIFTKEDTHKKNSNQFYNNKKVDSNLDYKAKDENLSWNYLRKQALAIYDYKCSRCGSKGIVHVHHKIPLSQGGTNDLCNLIPLCIKCHQHIHKFNFADEIINVPQNYGFNISKKEKRKIGYKILFAIKHKYKILIQYTANDYFKNSEITKRIISPKNLCMGYELKNEFYIPDEVYVIAFCELRQESRIFRLDRIKILKILKN